MDTREQHQEKRHPIQVAANRSGLTQDLLRAWEKRYGVVVPGRSGGGQRLYSDVDVERLRLLKLVVDGGRRISDVAPLSTEELGELVVEDQAESATSVELPVVDPVALIDCLDAIERLDAVRLEEILSRQLLSAGSQNLIEGLVAPVMVEVGRRWHEGQLLASHEHLATGVLRGLVARVLADSQPREPRGTIVVGTTPGQAHEVGGLMAAATAAQEQWRAVYLGAQLPPEEILGAAKQVNADAVALSFSIENPQHDDLGEIRAVVTGLSEGVLAIVGGAMARAKQAELKAMGAVAVADLSTFRESLRAAADRG
jgi:methanogenic corrinoid protein MtbC1